MISQFTGNENCTKLIVLTLPDQQILFYHLFAGPSANSDMVFFHKGPEGGFKLLAEYPEDLAFCQEICIKNDNCTTVGQKDMDGEMFCLVMKNTHPCETVDVWVKETYEIMRT